MPAFSSNRLLQTAIPIAALGWLYVFGANATASLVCPFRWATNLPCPLCGLTHALAALVHGDVVAAVLWHPFSPLALAGLVATAAGRTLPPPLWTRLALGLAVFGGLRMLVTAL